jgi:hypothetical protein
MVSNPPRVQLRLLSQLIRPERLRSRGWDEAASAVIEEQDDSRPLMTADKSLAMGELLGVFRMQTGTMLERTVKEHRYFPGKTFQGVQRFGKLLGLLLGEALERRDGNVGMGLQHLTELGFVESRKMGGFCEGMFRRHHHQQE